MQQSIESIYVSVTGTSIPNNNGSIPSNNLRAGTHKIIIYI